MYRTASPFCAGCGMPVNPREADIVDYGSGYRCFRCTLAGQIAEHDRRSEGSGDLLDPAGDSILSVLNDDD